jgi:hypothetical protein
MPEDKSEPTIAELDQYDAFTRDLLAGNGLTVLDRTYAEEGPTEVVLAEMLEQLLREVGGLESLARLTMHERSALLLSRTGLAAFWGHIGFGDGSSAPGP